MQPLYVQKIFFVTPGLKGYKPGQNSNLGCSDDFGLYYGQCVIFSYTEANRLLPGSISHTWHIA